MGLNGGLWTSASGRGIQRRHEETWWFLFHWAMNGDVCKLIVHTYTESSDECTIKLDINIIFRANSDLLCSLHVTISV